MYIVRISSEHRRTCSRSLKSSHGKPDLGTISHSQMQLSISQNMSEKQGWTGGPSTRGTFDILWICVCTLALCVWSAVHPNILLAPSSKRALLARLGMMSVAIVFPEVIISSAWRQLRTSQWLRTEINCLYLNRAEENLRVCRVLTKGCLNLN